MCLKLHNSFNLNKISNLVLVLHLFFMCGHKENDSETNHGLMFHIHSSEQMHVMLILFVWVQWIGCTRSVLSCRVVHMQITVWLHKIKTGEDLRMFPNQLCSCNLSTSSYQAMDSTNNQDSCEKCMKKNCECQESDCSCCCAECWENCCCGCCWNFCCGCFASSPDCCGDLFSIGIQICTLLWVFAGHCLGEKCLLTCGLVTIYWNMSY